MSKRNSTEISEGSEEKSPKRACTASTAGTKQEKKEDVKSTFGFTAEQSLILADFAFCNKRRSPRVTDVDGILLKKVAPILRVLAGHKTVESSILWRMLTEHVYSAFDDEDQLLKAVKVIFGDGPEQVPFVDLDALRVQHEPRRPRNAHAVSQGSDGLEEWMLAEFARLMPLASPKNVAIMINGLALTCTTDGTDRFLAMISQAERFSKFEPLHEVSNALKAMLPVGLYSPAVACLWKIRDLCDLRAEA